MEQFIHQGVVFKLYPTPRSTWKAYTRFGGESKFFHKKKKEDAIEAARTYAENRANPFHYKITIDRKKAEMYQEAESILSSFNVTLLEAARYYAHTHAGVACRITVYDAAQKCDLAP